MSRANGCSRACLIADVERLLLRCQAIEKPSDALKQRREEEEDDGLDEDIGMVNARGTGIRGGPRSGRNGNESDDSDFDL